MSYWNKFYFALILLGVAFAGSGCAVLGPIEDPTRFYVLDVPDYIPVSQETEPGLVLGVNRVQVARYLDSPGVTIREGDHRVFHSQRNRWAESMEHGLPRVLAESLRREPVVGQVVMDSAQRRQLPDYDLHASVLRAEGVTSVQGVARAVFHASWELRSGPDGEAVARGQVYEDDLPWDGQNFDQLVGSLSAGVGELSRQIARALEGLEQ